MGFSCSCYFCFSLFDLKFQCLLTVSTYSCHFFFSFSPCPSYLAVSFRFLLPDSVHFGSRHYPLQNNGLHQCREWDRPRPVAGSASLQSVAESYPSHQKFEHKAKKFPRTSYFRYRGFVILYFVFFFKNPIDVLQISLSKIINIAGRIRITTTILMIAPRASRVQMEPIIST